MALKKSEEKNTRKLAKIGKQSVGVTLPIEEVRKIGWRVGQKLTIKRIRGGFEIKDWRK
ncbi:MAG: hypothetical protein ACD_7C00522G0005 [uncultured bacterium]|nr:MAG: hypothetical protein ACD_7C00522G0005 [uncultured bacterium]KKP68349.1 MAG: hypothetical protein UR66_C0006G0050 [Candidatus Moranbacteria bacterium GW2011_GWE1_35_17]KKP73164.1 MAG: hypothetical protein UR65_C0006G0008 [Candidatus Moranbacteria bacterium GW2011_GWE2_35_164]KKP84266.1 MAG: hypothetical protein UR82_C0009G0013 [Candidatus Moranbacteria bacterium GW2011_GWF1_35_5]KKP84921.1 MAG: hypothetical protein UR83_C0008G0035 [Candidatus Moranbacteria bacterium GW2011_GWF2_35_54]